MVGGLPLRRSGEFGAARTPSTRLVPCDDRRYARLRCDRQEMKTQLRPLESAGAPRPARRRLHTKR